MNNIKIALENIVKNRLIIEVKKHLEKLYKLINNETTDENINIIRDLESFLVELENILLRLKENKICDEKASEIYNKIIDFIEEDKKD